MRAIQISRFGGPEELRLVEVPDPRPGPDQLLVNVDRVGVNFADTHQIQNRYLASFTLPLIPGAEVVGRTPEGRRVVAFSGQGGYAQKTVVPEAMAWDVPDGVDDVSALGFVVQGVAAWVLLRRSTQLTPGESVVVHAGAGGVGTIAIQLAKAWGAGRVIATASTEAKREIALKLGADAAVSPQDPNLTAALIRANRGRRVDIVLEMTGGTVTDQSIRALAPFGRLACYGNASRNPPSPVQPASLMAQSITIAGMWVQNLPGRLMDTALNDLFDLVQQGVIQVVPGGEYPLADARKAHEDLLARRTIGKLVLDPAS